MKILTFNSGSSSMKFSLFESDGEHLVADGLADWSTQPATVVIRRHDQPGPQEHTASWPLSRHGDAVGRVLDDLTRSSPGRWSLGEIAGVGHRVVHGGDRFTAPVLVTPEVKRTISDLAELAPLQNPANLEGIEAAEKALPGVPQVACFDTGFHASLTPEARTYPLPYEWSTDWGLRRYGFHGLSHEYCAGRARAMLGPERTRRLVVCHLGNGASVSAVRDGVCADTSMGYTPMEGLMMGTRCGSVDPGILLWVLRHKGITLDQLDEALNHRSGLKGVSGVSADVRTLLGAAPANPRAKLALDVFARRVRQTIGSMAAVLGGLDTLVFTAGIGEHAAPVRAACCDDLGFLGVRLDPETNARARPDADVAARDAPVRVLVLATREDVMILRATAKLAVGGTSTTRV